MGRKLPIELILIIYDFCDKPTRININKAYKWNYKYVNPFKEFSFINKNAYITNYIYYPTFLMTVYVYHEVRVTFDHQSLSYYL